VMRGEDLKKTQSNGNVSGLIVKETADQPKHQPGVPKNAF
jgi:hypothetical protein